MAILNSPLTLEDLDAGDTSFPELSLVDKDEFEEFLTVSQLVSELEPRFKIPLYQLDRRFSTLANRDIDERPNPIGPAVFAGVFAEELKNLRSHQIAIESVYRTLRAVLEANLEQLYQDANGLLIEFGVLPVIKKERTKYKRPPGSQTLPPPPLENTHGGDTIPPGLLEQTLGSLAQAVQQNAGKQQNGQPSSSAPGAGFDVINPGAATEAPVQGGNSSPQGAPPGAGWRWWPARTAGNGVAGNTTSCNGIPG